MYKRQVELTPEGTGYRAKTRFAKFYNLPELMAMFKAVSYTHLDVYKRQVQPKDLTASEISVRLGATWLPPDDVQEFIFHLLETPRYEQRW